MKRIALPTLCLLALLAMSLPAPAQPAADTDADSLLLRPREVALWKHWLRADHKACFEAAAAMLDDPECLGAEYRIALGLLARSAVELGWHPGVVKVLNAQVAERTDIEADWARFELIEALKRTGDHGPIHNHTQALGMLTRWSVLGPFANDRGQGFEDVLEPEVELNFAGEYAGKDGQNVAWRELPARPLAGEINLGALMRPNTEAVAYLVTSVWVDAAVAAHLYVASTGDIKVWHLGRVWHDMQGAEVEAESPLGVPLLEATDERPFGFDQNGAELKLNAGWNTLLVKSGVAENDWRVRARIVGTRLREARAEERAEVPMPQPFKLQDLSGLVDSFEMADDFARQTMLEMLYPRLDISTATPKRLMQDVLAAWDEYLGETPEAERAAHQPEGAVLHYLAAWANRSTTNVAAGREENYRRELLQKSLAMDDKAARSALELSYYYTGTFANPKQADEYAVKAVKLAPHWTEARIFGARVVQMKGLDMEAERELAALLKQHPQDPRVLRYSAYYAGMRGDYATSNGLFEQAVLRDQSDRYSLERLIERAVQRGDDQLASRYAKQLQKLDPFDTWAFSLLAQGLEHKGKHPEASELVNRALAVAPRDDALLEQLGRIYADWAYTDTARSAELRELSLQAFRDALSANPKREDLERYMEFLDGEQPPFEAALQENIEPRIKAALAAPIDTNEPYEVIYDDNITVINDDGTTSQYVQQAYRVGNDDGRRWLQSLQVPAWGGQQGRCVLARVWRADGSVEEGRRSRYSATFPPLQAGDVVHARFRVTDRERSFFGDFFGTIEVLADYVPVRRARVCFVLAPGKSYHEYRTLDAPSRIERSVNGRIVWIYETGDIAKLQQEALAPPSHQRAATIQISTYGDWAEFGRWYYNLIKKQLEPTPEMTRKVQQLTAGLMTEHEKARVLYEWVVTQVRYNADWHFGVHGYKPFSAGAVFARCIGDCKDKAILLCTMLGIAGIKAHPVIINLAQYPEYRGREDITLPMPHHFNHAIACIEYADGSLQFVDGTATYSGFDELPPYDAGADVIVVKPDGGIRMKVPQPAAAANLDTDTIEAECIGGGTLRLKVVRTAAGGAAANIRSGFLRPGDRKRLLELEYARHFPGAKLIEVTASDLSDLRSQPEIRFTVELPNAYTEKDGVIEMRQSLAPMRWGQSLFASLASRKTELLLPPPYAQQLTLKLAIPAGKKAGALPKAYSSTSRHLELGLAATLSADGRTVTVTRTVTMHGGIVPVAEYVAFRRALVDFDAAELHTLKLGR